MCDLTFGSLFAGIGGIDLGLERAGMRCAWQVEIDEYASRVLQKHWPQVPRFKDVRECGAHNLPQTDVIAGGFPCQDISNAGQRIGIDGNRSGLWREFARIVGELRPRYVLVENVSALLIRGMGAVLGDLAALRYDAEWHCIPAASVGAPHIRDRVFILAYADRGERGTQPQTRDVTNGTNTGRQKTAGGLAIYGADGRAQIVADAHQSRLLWWAGKQRQGGRAELEDFCGTVGREQWSVEPSVGRMAYGVPARLDRLRGLGNAVVPQVAEYIGRCIVAHANEVGNV